MESKISLDDFRWLALLSVAVLAVTLPGCAAFRQAPEEQSPRALASLRLTEQGRMLLERGDIDSAISVLERAINLNPSNGHNYYYLSEAWLSKGNTKQAQEFNRLAEIHLDKDRRWIRQVMEQKERILKLERSSFLPLQ